MNKKLNFLFLAAILIFLFLGVNAAYAYTLSGIIYGGSNPMPNATVNLYDASTGNQLQSTVTNSSGFYSFTVDNGTYNLIITPPPSSGFGESKVNGIPVNGADVTQNVILIQQAVILSGTVRYPDGTVAQNIRVYANGLSGETGGSALSDTSGHYSIPVGGGTYQIEVRGGNSYGAQNKPSPGHFRWYSPFQLSITGNQTQDITLPSFATVSGKTTDANGVAIGNVRVSHAWANLTCGSATCYISDESVYSDANGNYSMVLLPYSNYTFTVYPPQREQLSADNSQWY
jgi:hypothetical protein